MATEYWRDREVRSVMTRWIIVASFDDHEEAQKCMKEEQEYARQYEPSPQFKIEELEDGKYQVLQKTH